MQQIAFALQADLMFEKQKRPGETVSHVGCCKLRRRPGETVSPASFCQPSMHLFLLTTFDVWQKTLRCQKRTLERDSSKLWLRRLTVTKDCFPSLGSVTNFMSKLRRNRGTVRRRRRGCCQNWYESHVSTVMAIHSCHDAVAKEEQEIRR